MADVDARAFEDTRAFVTARPEPSIWGNDPGLLRAHRRAIDPRLWSGSERCSVRVGA
jgi:hypothetical protein